MVFAYGQATGEHVLTSYGELRQVYSLIREYFILYECIYEEAMDPRMCSDIAGSRDPISRLKELDEIIASTIFKLPFVVPTNELFEPKEVPYLLVLHALGKVLESAFNDDVFVEQLFTPKVLIQSDIVILSEWNYEIIVERLRNMPNTVRLWYTIEVNGRHHTRDPIYASIEPVHKLLQLINKVIEDVKRTITGSEE